jgi:hypothetical protein
MLQIAFGWRRLDELRLLDDEEMRRVAARSAQRTALLTNPRS